MFYLLMVKPSGRATPIQVTCAIGGNAEGLVGKHRGFAQLSELESELYAAGVSEYSVSEQLRAVHTGLPIFIQVSAEVAKKLGLLEGEFADSTTESHGKASQC